MQQVQVQLDTAIYNRLQELQVPPCNSINDVINRLLYHNGHKSKEVVALEAEEQHFTFADEIERTKAGIYDSAAS